MLRYLSEASEVREQLAGQPQAEVIFNYAGRGEVEQRARRHTARSRLRRATEQHIARAAAAVTCWKLMPMRLVES